MASQVATTLYFQNKTEPIKLSALYFIYDSELN